MSLKYLLAGAAFAVGLAGAVAANAKIVNLGPEGDAGFNGVLFGNYGVASDGEVNFDPYMAGYDTTDGLNFNNVGFPWAQAADSSWNFLGNQTWVLPAAQGPCGNENEPVCESLGHFVSPNPWVQGVLGTYYLTDGNSSGGPISDVIVLYNDANGANVLFASDPTLLPVPEPAAWTTILLGFFGLGATLRGRRKVSASATV